MTPFSDSIICVFFFYMSRDGISACAYISLTQTRLYNHTQQSKNFVRATAFVAFQNFFAA